VIIDFIKVMPKVEVIYNHDFYMMSEEAMKDLKIPSRLQGM